MERMRKSPGIKVKKKMTREQMQLAIIKKKECDAKALAIVEQLVEPIVDPEWLLKNLKNINRCHMEDVIEERAITKVCGYVLCQKPLTIVINQRYHISLKNKKVFDVTKRKNFCSSGCFGASNYLLEQMLTSPLWLRDKEEIPKFRIFSGNIFKSTHGEEVDISEDRCQIDKDTDKQIVSTHKENVIVNIQSTANEITRVIPKDKINLQNIKDSIYEKEKNKNDDSNYICESIQNSIQKVEDVELVKSTTTIIDTSAGNSHVIENSISDKVCIDEDIIEQHIYNVQPTKTNINLQTTNKFKEKENCISSNHQILDSEINKNETKDKNIKINKNELSSQEQKIKSSKKQKLKESKAQIETNLAATVEHNFQEWITEETIHFLFGDDSVKQKAIKTIEHQDRYSALCEKLNRLQFQDEEEDSEILEKRSLKPAPHFAVLQEEGQKLELKVRAYFQGKTTFEELKKSNISETDADAETFLPLTDVHAPQTLRRKIFLDRLDQVLPDLLRTLAGNNEVYARTSINYTSLRCTVVKALVHTFSLSSKNIIFKTAEWTLVALVIIKMLSLLDPWLATLLESKQANMYTSMILTSYKLDPNYLNLFVASFNPNVNPR